MIRTESDGVVRKKKEGTLCKHARGINESHSVFQQVTVKSNNGKSTGKATIMRVPYSRITGMYFMERTPGSGIGCFAGDQENEFDAFTAGLNVYYAGVAKMDDSVDNIIKYLK